MNVMLTVRIPKTLHSQVRELAEEEGISMNQFVMLALAEKVATLQAVGYLEERAKRGSREKLLAVLAKVTDVEPEEYDRLD
ncbi:MAG: toxin-antitoxin system HicB family antitoxin [Ardenticatenaceae bacterium]|nr:toxin-antitoxin system HicB family antitoxin [Ardenticatenaceae bacterium]